MRLDKKAIRRLMGLIGFAVLATWAVFRPWELWGILRVVGSIVAPFVLGLVIAFVVNLLLQPVERLWGRVFGRSLRGLKRPVSILLSVAIIVAVVFVLLFIVLPEVVDTIVLVVEAMPQWVAQLQTWWGQLGEWLAPYGVVLPPLNVNASELGTMATEWLGEHGPSLLAGTLGFTTSFVSGVVNVIIALVFALYLLSQKEKFGDQARRVLHAYLPEPRAQGVIEVVELSGSVFTKYVTGQLTDAVILGVLCYIGMLVLRMPHAAAISILIAATVVIPIVGVILGSAIGAFLILVVDPVKALWFIVFITVLQQLEANFIYPRVVGKSVGVPGIWVFAAVIVGGTLLGVLGMVLAVPICAVLYSLFRRSVHRRLGAEAVSGDG